MLLVALFAGVTDAVHHRGKRDMKITNSLDPSPETSGVWFANGFMLLDLLKLLQVAYFSRKLL
jgi:hypothetical protein